MFSSINIKSYLTIPFHLTPFVFYLSSSNSFSSSPPPQCNSFFSLFLSLKHTIFLHIHLFCSNSISFKFQLILFSPVSYTLFHSSLHPSHLNTLPHLLKSTKGQHLGNLNRKLSFSDFFLFLIPFFLLKILIINQTSRVILVN